MAKSLSITALTDSVSTASTVAVEFYLSDGVDDIWKKIAPLYSLQVIYYHQEEQITVNSGGVHLFSYDATNVTEETGVADVESLFNSIKTQLYA